MYFTFKPGWLKFGESGCLKDKTSKSGTDLRPHSVKLRSHQNGKTLPGPLPINTTMDEGDLPVPRLEMKAQ